MYAQLAGTTHEGDRRQLQQASWNIRKRWFAEQLSRRLCENVRRGKVIEKSKKLFNVEAMVLSAVHPGRSGQTSSSPDDWSAEVSAQFSRKWGVNRLQDRANIIDCLLATDACGIDVLPESLMLAFDRIKCKARVDHYGISISAVKIIACAKPGLVSDFFAKVSASTSIMSDIV